MVDTSEIVRNLPHPDSTVYASSVPLNGGSTISEIDLVLPAASGDVSHLPLGVTDVHAMQRVEFDDDIALSLVGAYVSCLPVNGGSPSLAEAATSEDLEGRKGTLVRGAMGWFTGENYRLSPPREHVVFEAMIDLGIISRTFRGHYNALPVIMARAKAGSMVQNALAIVKEHGQAEFIETPPGLF